MNNQQTPSGPRFSIFIPVWNDSVWVRGAIDSVIAQTYPDWELVIGDNASEDELGSLVGKYVDPRIRYHRWATHVPIFENFNRTMMLTRNEWVQFLGADDRLRPECLARMAAALDEHRGEGRVSMVLTGCRRIGRDGRSADRVWYGSKDKIPVRRARYEAADWMILLSSDGQRPFNIGSEAVARSVIEESGGFFKPEVGLSADLELELRVAAYGSVIYIDEPLLDFTVRTDADGPTRLLANRANGERHTTVDVALTYGLRVHEARRAVAPRERRAVQAAIARSYMQRAAQHRVLPAGRGRRGAIADAWRALRKDPRTVVRLMSLMYLGAAVLAPRRVLHAGQRALASRHSA